MTDKTYYASTAYNPANIPDQPASTERSWLRKLGATRLPWGRTQDVAPESIMTDPTPKSMRFWEQADKEKAEEKALGIYKEGPLEGAELHWLYDHERFRYAVLSKRSHFWLYLFGGGRFSFYLFLVLSVFVYFVEVIQTKQSWLAVAIDSASFYGLLLGIPLFCWGLGYLVVHKFPKLWFKPSRGPIWELNRRTGLVTVFDYDNNGEYKKNGTIGELTAPFYEFDAYLRTSPDRQGLPMNFLYMAHRYRDITINFASLVAADRTPNLAFALWDFLQNYMDVTRPLPELPCFEESRHLDPVSAEHDKQINRPARYWIDMDDETFDVQLKEMSGRIFGIDTLSRPNLMAQHVEYAD
ncbi:hypothetical protein [Pseudomonas sp. M30-35]|uniref:hypothetical protein n=1 Tax=Pseudomonas sp. M30-35 TaxID=1981174 RepID=UPI000B3C1649|nr:hypothetical protein [Pseudomonas sp. M30-35]ARU87303.1 hypothetical protein B9K09_04575 [Pseudomonas sp. M30-35]